MATVTAVQPPGRFGSLILDKQSVTSFQEKPLGDGGWVNGGFFVLNPEVFNYISGDKSVFETDTLVQLVNKMNWPHINILVLASDGYIAR